MSSDQPWLNDPPVTAPQGQPNVSQPWLNDPPASPKDTSYGSAFQAGLHDAGEGLGSTLSLLSKDVGWKGGQNAGQALQNAVPAPANYSSAGGDVASDIKSGKFLQALKDTPRALVEGAPQVAGGLASAGLGGLVGGPVGAAVGAGAYGAASAFGDDANARAAANGHAAPTAGDQLAAAPTAVAQGALNAVGLGKVPGVGGLIAKSPAFLRSLAAGGVDAAGQAASNVVGQVGNTVGTKQGLTVDPSQVAAAAIQGAAARAGLMAGHQVAGAAKDAAGAGVTAVGNGVSAFGNKLAASDLPAMTDDQAASFNRINNAYDAQTPSQTNANATQRMNGLWKQQRANLQQVIGGAIATGQVDDATGTALKTALQQAAVHKSALDTSLLDKLNSGNMDPRLAQTITTGLTDLDNLSSMVNYKQATGPFAALGAKLAVPTAIVGGGLLALHGAPVEGTGSILAGLAGTAHNKAGEVGRTIGGVADRVFGTVAPPSLILRSQALKQAQAAGYDTTQDAVSPVTSAYDTLNALKAQQGQDASNQRSLDLQEAAANTLSGQDYKNSEEGTVARAKLAAQKAEWIAQAKADGRIPQPMTQDQRDRVMMGLSPSDPIPVNVPLGAGNVPLQQASPPASAGQDAPAASPRAPQPAPLQQPQGAPQGAPVAPQAGINGWQDHLAHTLWQRGVPTTPQTIPNAVQNLVKSGNLHPDMAQSLMSQPQNFLGDRSPLFNQIAAQAMQDHGMQPPPPPAPDNGPIRYPLRWQAAGANYQALGGSLQNMAAGQGDIPLATAIARITATSSAQQKLDIASHELAQRQHDAIALARAKALLVPELLKGK